jgi:PPOX class probable F420-dependent enzyme
MTPDGAEPAASPAGDADRRSFLRQLSGDAVRTAGRLAGASALIRGSLAAAGEMAVRDLESEADADSPMPAPADTGLANPAPERRIPADAGPVPVPMAVAVPDPVAAMTAEQHAFLDRGSTAVLAVNDPAGSPHITASMYHWDGTALRLPAQDFTARAINIDRDPRVSVLIEDPASGAWVAISGSASLIYGDPVEPDMLRILGKYHEPAEARDRWGQMRSGGSRIVILVHPSRFVWRPA